ncbi:hypothetical protein [Streptomyces sp. NPDC046862]|uniref:hypothetical protein n=1 Tax=Streptomyces sp. NPDC046862 TaxID=3154603 RepID=UPI003452C8E8
MLPMARPALLTLTILSFQGSWNELGHFIVSRQSPELNTLTTGVASLVSGQLGSGNQYPLKLAAALQARPRGSRAGAPSDQQSAHASAHTGRTEPHEQPDLHERCHARRRERLLVALRGHPPGVPTRLRRRRRSSRTSAGSPLRRGG